MRLGVYPEDCLSARWSPLEVRDLPPHPAYVGGMVSFRFRFFVFLLAAAISFKTVHAQTATTAGLRLPALISDHMVLQNGKATTLWGWSTPNTAIKAEFLDTKGKVLATASGIAPPEGRWMLRLPALPAATAGTLRITGGMAVKTIQDVVAGEVWLAGGQSNMTYNLGHKLPPELKDTTMQDVTAANGAIRFFNVDTNWATAPNDDVKGHWFIVTGSNYQQCSAVAWNFAVALREKIHAPAGMIVSAVGGTSVTLWMPKAALDSCPPGPDIEQKMTKNVADTNEKIKQSALDDAAWLKLYPTPELQAQNIKTRPRKYGPAHSFSELYNGMIHGLEPYTVKGVIWFQADGDMGICFAYGDLIKSMIKAWRAAWGEELPFYYVEMNNMREFPPKTPAQSNDSLSIIRQQQQAALELPQTDVACSIDLGLLEPEPHFPNKKPVGQRLALLAFNNVYGMPCAAHSPAYESSKVEGNKIRLHFKYAEGLRVRGGGEAIGFEIRGADGHWVWATAKVDGEEMLVWNDEIPNPTEVHYGWSMNPLISMENGAGLPMRPFSTVMIKP